MPAAPIGRIAQWLADGPVWAIVVLGVLTEERQLRAEEHRCLDELRAQGVIR